MMTRAHLASLAIIISGFSHLPCSSFADDSAILLEMMRQQQARSAADEVRLFRPSPQEREAVGKLIEMKPRPKTFNDADIRYLKTLLDKATWFGAERRIMHEMWAEAIGKEWGAGEAENSKPAKPPL
ncbi:MAG TPA: hypothetical protein VKB81_19105 [Nitrospira sp.]|nr:hypothetical protein [Nitrospira sp.]